MVLHNTRVALVGRFEMWTQAQLKGYLQAMGVELVAKVHRADVVLAGKGAHAAVARAEALGRRVVGKEGLRAWLTSVGNSNMRLGLLRGVLHGPQTQEQWEALCVVFECWPEEEDLGLALDYAEGHICGWEWTLRSAPWPWVRRLCEEGREPRMRIVRVISARGRRLGVARIKRLANASSLGEVYALELPTNGMGPNGLRFLLEASYMASVRVLNLYDNRLKDSDVAALAAAPQCRQIVYLELGSNLITDEGIRALCASPYLTSLIYLDLMHISMTIEGLRVLMQSPLVRQLEWLNIWGNLVEPGLAEEVETLLTDSPYLPEECVVRFGSW